MSEKRKLGCMGMGTGMASEQQAGSPQPLLSTGTCGLYLANSPCIQGWLVAKGRISADSELENLAGW